MQVATACTKLAGALQVILADDVRPSKGLPNLCWKGLWRCMIAMLRCVGNDSDGQAAASSNFLLHRGGGKMMLRGLMHCRRPYRQCEQSWPWRCHAYCGGHWVVHERCWCENCRTIRRGIHELWHKVVHTLRRKRMRERMLLQWVL